MTPRKADLRVAHSSKCPNATRTALDSLKGCKCQPAYYVQWRDPSGATRKSTRVRDRRLADKMLREQQVEIDRGNAGYVEQRDITFPEWVAEYDTILERRPGLKGETRRKYAETLRVAADAIGYVPVRRIGNQELRQYHARIIKTAPATQLRHLRHLSACLTAAVDEGYADRNPVGPFRKTLRLRAASGTPPYTDGEIAAIVAAMHDEEPVYPMVVRAAVTTGARIGELVALDWTDINLSDGTIRIRHTWNPVDGLTAPKDRDERTVYLTPAAQAVFAGWVKHVGVQDSGPVFPAPRSKGRLNADYIRKLVNKAITTAGVAKLDTLSGRPRKPFHSLRATFARQQLEAGKNPQWVEAQLGHADLKLTVGVYGAWGEDAMRAEAAKVAT